MHAASSALSSRRPSIASVLVDRSVADQSGPVPLASLDQYSQSSDSYRQRAQQRCADRLSGVADDAPDQTAPYVTGFCEALWTGTAE